MATQHELGKDLTIRIDKKAKKGHIEFTLTDPVKSDSGKMMMLLSTKGFKETDLEMDGKTLKVNIQVGTAAK